MKKTMNLGIDLFSSKDMSARVTDFMNAKGRGVTLRKRSGIKIAEWSAAIKALQIADKDAMVKTPQSKYDELNKMIEDERAALQKSLESAARFEWNDADRALYKAYKSGNLADGLDKWFGNYGYKTVSRTLAYFENHLNGDQGGATARRMVNHDEYTRNVRTPSNFFAVFYGALVEAELSAGVIKAYKWDDDIKKAFAPRKKNA